MKRLPLALALVAALIAPAFAEDAPKDAKPALKAELGSKAPAVVIQDTEGRSFELQDCGITKKDAVAVVMAKALTFGAGKDAKPETKIADLKGVKDGDGDVDATKVRDLALACGAYFGLIATEESAESFKTLGDLVTWIEQANTSPILLVTFSPRCGSVKRQAERILEMAAATKVRIFAIACNTKDTDEHLAKFKESRDWPVRTFWDREQRITDMIGGKVTPHFFLFDKDAVLRYRGGMNNDPMGFMEDEERKDYVIDAVSAIRAGKAVPVSDTEPSG